MSHNNKNAKRVRAARERKRTKGFKGPARTTKKNTKVNVWWRKPKAAANAKSKSAEE